MARVGLTAERLTEAAADLADEVGLENVTLSALARRFGVKDASLYAHVKGARDLRDRVSVRSAREFADVLGEAIAGRSGREAMLAFANAYRDFALAHPGRYAAVRLPPPAGAVADYHRLSATTYAMLRGYGLAEPAATDAVRLLHSAFHGFVGIEASGGFRYTARETADSWARALEALDAALTHLAASPAGGA
ncbi:WHG domain-containing protein [Streptomyces sp. NPDC051940]|uniref:TetR/AcrR family transcriptional regulator n=1 Tax=Streptomyces sp. NPDC051940 TaxID=3155675 RepID=UPI00341361A4